MTHFIVLKHGRSRTGKPYWVNVADGNVVALQEDSQDASTTHVFLKGYERTCPVAGGPEAVAAAMGASWHDAGDLRSAPAPSLASGGDVLRPGRPPGPPGDFVVSSPGAARAELWGDAEDMTDGPGPGRPPTRRSR
jgi:hypothetical protein